MPSLELTFGGTDIVVMVDGGGPSTARMCAVVNNGTEVQPLADRQGLEVEIARGGPDEALAAARHYLTERFGIEGPPRPAQNPLIARDVIAPLVDTRP
jgi:hypothetical protein